METWWTLLILKESTSCVSLDASLKAKSYDQASGCVWWWQHNSYTCIHSRLILLLYLKYREVLLLTLFFSYWQIELSTKVVIHLVLCIVLYCQAINSETFVTLLSKNNTLTISLLPLKFLVSFIPYKFSFSAGLWIKNNLICNCRVSYSHWLTLSSWICCQRLLSSTALALSL